MNKQSTEAKPIKQPSIPPLEEILENFNMSTSVRVLLDNTAPLDTPGFRDILIGDLLFPYLKGRTHKSHSKSKTFPKLVDAENLIFREYLPDRLRQVYMAHPVLQQIDNITNLRKEEWMALIGGHIGSNDNVRLVLRFINHPRIAMRIMKETQFPGVVRLNGSLIYPLNKVLIRGRPIPDGKTSLIEFWRHTEYNGTFRLPKRGVTGYSANITADAAKLDTPFYTKREHAELRDPSQDLVV